MPGRSCLSSSASIALTNTSRSTAASASRRVTAACSVAFDSLLAAWTISEAERRMAATQRADADAGSPTGAPSNALGTSAPSFCRAAISAVVDASRARVRVAPSAMRWSASNTCTQHSTASRKSSMKFSSSLEGVESP